MTHKKMTGLAMIAVAAGLLLTLAVSSVSHDPTSAFAEPSRGAAPLVADAREAGVDVRRLASSPAAIRNDVDLRPSETLLVVAGPQSAYSDEEVAYVRTFLEKGGRVLVLDDFGHANVVTSEFGITYERVRLVDPARNNSVQIRTGGNPYTLWTDRPTALQLDPDRKFRILARSSAGSFLDRDGNGVIDESDPQGAFPVAVERRVGEHGRLIAIADRAPVLTKGADRLENRPWRQQLIRNLLSESGTMVVDESHRPVADPFVSALGPALKAAALPPWRWILAIGVAAGVIGTALPHAIDRWTSHEFNPDRYIPRSLLAPSDDDSEEPQDSETVASRDRWTSRGIVALAGGGALGIGGLVLGNVQATYAGALLLVAAAASLAMRYPSIDVDREMSATRVREGAGIEIRLRLSRNGHGAGEIEIRDPLPPEFDLVDGDNWFQARLAHRTEVTADYETVPHVRGPYEVGPTIARKSDPLRLRIHESRVDDASRVEVVPRAEDTRETPYRTRIPTVILGPHKVNRSGDGAEFHSLREYREGDSYRDINWKASARVQEDFFVNQHVHESMTTLTLFVDARWVSGAGPARSTPLNESARIALSLVEAAMKARNKVRIIVYGDGVEMIEPASRERQLHQLEEILATVTPSGETTFLEAVHEVLPDLPSEAPVLLVSGLERDPSIMDGMRNLRARELFPVVVACPVHAAEEDEAERLERKRKKLMAALRGADVPVYDARAGASLDYLFRSGEMHA